MQKAERQAIVNGLSRSQWVELIHEWVHDEVNRAILTRTLLDGVSYERVAEELDLSVEATKKRAYKAQTLLFKRI